jgi:hypothetical protein
MSGSAKLLSGIAFAALLGAALPAQAAVNLVSNGGFETGDLTGWSTNGWAVNLGGLSAFDGAFYASTGCVNHLCDLSQTLATQAGATYTISFAFNPGEGAGLAGDNTDAMTRILWNGTAISAIAGGTLGWETITLSPQMATGSSTVLTFSGYQNPAFNGLDDVSVVLDSIASVPEPSTWAMLILGFGLVGGALRQQRRTKVAFA